MMFGNFHEIEMGRVELSVENGEECLRFGRKHEINNFCAAITKIAAAVIGDNCGSYLVQMGCFLSENRAKYRLLEGY